jgi:putative membrane protein
MHILGAIVRFIISAIVLMIVGWIVPNFTVGWIIEGVFGKNVSPFGRGIVGFLTSALVIWIAQFIVGGVSVTMIGAIVAALVIGIIDLFVPVNIFNEKNRRRSTT